MPPAPQQGRLGSSPSPAQCHHCAPGAAEGLTVLVARGWPQRMARSLCVRPQRGDPVNS